MPVKDTIPWPLVFDPLSGIHKHTIILLHGRGRTAGGFADDILGSVISEIPKSAKDLEPEHTAEELAGSASPKSFQQLLPDARFVFPRARKTRATVYKRSAIRQWFDDWHLDSEHTTDVVDSHYDDGLQTSGLGETVAYLHDLITQEAVLVGSARDIVLGGISQGAAVSLVTGLLWKGGESLGGVVGMCAWLPYARQMMDEHNRRANVGDVEGEKHGAGTDNFDPFERSSSPADENRVGGSRGLGDAALRWLREEIELPGAPHEREVGSEDSGSTPVLLCHGLNDEKVEPERSHVALRVLPNLGVGPVLRRTSPGVGHGFSSDMLGDIVDFLLQTRGVTLAEESNWDVSVGIGSGFRRGP